MQTCSTQLHIRMLATGAAVDGTYKSISLFSAQFDEVVFRDEVAQFTDHCLVYQDTACGQISVQKLQHITYGIHTYPTMYTQL